MVGEDVRPQPGQPLPPVHGPPTCRRHGEGSETVDRSPEQGQGPAAVRGSERGHERDQSLARLPPGQRTQRIDLHVELRAVGGQQGQQLLVAQPAEGRPRRESAARHLDPEPAPRLERPRKIRLPADPGARDVAQVLPPLGRPAVRDRLQYGDPVLALPDRCPKPLPGLVRTGEGEQLQHIGGPRALLLAPRQLVDDRRRRQLQVPDQPCLVEVAGVGLVVPLPVPAYPVVHERRRGSRVTPRALRAQPPATLQQPFQRVVAGVGQGAGRLVVMAHHATPCLAGSAVAMRYRPEPRNASSQRFGRGR